MTKQLGAKGLSLTFVLILFVEIKGSFAPNWSGYKTLTIGD
jgi:hypothetical protein